MNLDELVESIPNSESELRTRLKNWISDWKKSDSTLTELTYLMEKWNGNIWFKEEQTQNLFYQNWSSFKTRAIDSIDGMTINERLYWFGLFNIWDNSNAEFKKIIRTKLKVK